MGSEIFMNVKINDKQKGGNRTIEEQMSDDWRLTKINSWRTARRSLLMKFFADENLLLYSKRSIFLTRTLCALQCICVHIRNAPLTFVHTSSMQPLHLRTHPHEKLQWHFCQLETDKILQWKHSSNLFWSNTTWLGNKKKKTADNCHIIVT